MSILDFLLLSISRGKKFSSVLTRFLLQGEPPDSKADSLTPETKGIKK